MNTSSRQSGSTLAVALVMLVVLTLLVISAMRSSTSNLKVAGNMQMQQEAQASAQQALEQILSTNFTVYPASSVINVDSNGDSATDFAVSVATPTCLGSTALTNSTPNLPVQCLSSGAATNTGIVSASGVVPTAQSWCYEQQWEVRAVAENTGTGATAAVNQGTALTVPAGTACN